MPSEEAEVVSQAVVVGLHALMEMAQNQELDPAERITAVSEIFDFAHDDYSADEEEEGEEEDDEDDEPGDPPNRPRLLRSLALLYLLREPKGK